jgi:hypothetical protein
MRYQPHLNEHLRSMAASICDVIIEKDLINVKNPKGLYPDSTKSLIDFRAPALDLIETQVNVINIIKLAKGLHGERRRRRHNTASSKLMGNACICDIM